MIMKKAVLVLIACALSAAVCAAQDVNVIFQTPSVVRIVKGDAIPADSYSVTASPAARNTFSSSTTPSSLPTSTPSAHSKTNAPYL